MPAAHPISHHPATPHARTLSAPRCERDADGRDARARPRRASPRTAGRAEQHAPPPVHDHEPCHEHTRVSRSRVSRAPERERVPPDGQARRQSAERPDSPPVCVCAFQNPRYIQTHIYCNPVENAPPLHGAAHIRRGKTRYSIDARALLPLEGGEGVRPLPACHSTACLYSPEAGGL